MTPSRQVRRALDRQTDARIRSLHGVPTLVQDAGDLVVLVDGHAEPWVIPSQCARLALILIAGTSFAAEVLAIPPPAGHVRVLVIIGTVVQLGWCGLVPLAKGGAA